MQARTKGPLHRDLARGLRAFQEDALAYAQERRSNVYVFIPTQLTTDSGGLGPMGAMVAKGAPMGAAKGAERWRNYDSWKIVGQEEGASQC